MADNEIIKGLERRLKAKTIHDLRQIARHVGVQRPTEGRKERILEDILNIAAGRIDPVEQSSIGAPPKSNEYDRQLVLEIMQSRAHYLSSVQQDDKESAPEMKVASSGSVNEFTVDGILDKSAEGWLLRLNGKCSAATDVSVSETFIDENKLRVGDLISGIAKRKQGEAISSLLSVIKVNGSSPDCTLSRAQFEQLVPTYPDSRINLSASGMITGRIIDLVSPIGAGQRTLVAAPHGAGKTTILKNIALSIQDSGSGVKVIVLLIDARPEESADFARILPSADVISSTLDLSSSAHVRTAKLALEYAKRQVESSKDVVLILDSITGLTRAFNSNGVQVSSSLEQSAVEEAKKFLSCARNIEGGGSLTIIAAASYGNGDPLEDAICLNLKDTFNSRIILSTPLVRARVYPPIDIAQSQTSGDERLLSETELSAQGKLRGEYEKGGMQAVVEKFIDTQSNAELCEKLTTRKD